MITASGEKVFGNGFNKIGCRHEDADGAEDGEEREGHEAQPVNDRRSKLPLVAHRLVLILVPKALGDVPHLVQDLGQLQLHVGPRSAALTGGQEHLVLAGPAQQPSAEDPRVGGGGGRGAVDALQAADADVKHVAIGGLGGQGAGVQVHAGQAAAPSLVVTG